MRGSALHRLEELSEARQRVVNRVKATEKDRDGLEGAKAVAEAYLSKERECTITQSVIFQIFVRDGQAWPRLWPALGNLCIAASAGSYQKADDAHT